MLEDLSKYASLVLFRVGIARVAVFLATLFLSCIFLGLFDRLLKAQEAFHDLRKGIKSFFLTAAMALLSNGCFPAETLL